MRTDSRLMWVAWHVQLRDKLLQKKKDSESETKCLLNAFKYFNLSGSNLVDLRGKSRWRVNIRVRVQIIRHLKTCTTDVYLQNECAHVGLSVHAPVDNVFRLC